MANPFLHDVLGKCKSEERWLKIFPRPIGLRLLMYEGTALFMGTKLGPSSGFFIFLAVVIAVYGLVWSLLSILEKDTIHYQKGGGITYASLFKRKRQHKKERAVYVLGIKAGTGVNGKEK